MVRLFAVRLCPVIGYLPVRVTRPLNTRNGAQLGRKGERVGAEPYPGRLGMWHGTEPDVKE